MSFKDVIGQEGASALLKTAFRNKRLAHAYIFVGPDGVGKRKTALNFAKLLVCENSSEQEPCDLCASCRKTEAFQHPDVQWVEPEGQFVKIDSVREACRRLSLRGFESSKKVLVIAEAPSLNDESANALLKTLEEPSFGTVLILLTDTLRSVLPTIASRCQKIVFCALREETLETILEHKFGIPRSEAVFLSRFSEGSLGVALRHHDRELFSRKNRIIQAALNREVPLEKLLESSQSEDKAEKDIKMGEVLSVLSSWFRDLMFAKISVSSNSFINGDKKNDLLAASLNFSLEEIDSRLSALAEAAMEKDRNINRKISLAKLRAELWK